VLAAFCWPISLPVFLSVYLILLI